MSIFVTDEAARAELRALLETQGTNAAVSDFALVVDASPELTALAECIKAAAPGVKLPPLRLARAVEQMLKRRGYCVRALMKGPDHE